MIFRLITQNKYEEYIRIKVMLPGKKLHCLDQQLLITIIGICSKLAQINTKS